MKHPMMQSDSDIVQLTREEFMVYAPNLSVSRQVEAMSEREREIPNAKIANPTTYVNEWTR